MSHPAHESALLTALESRAKGLGLTTRLDGPDGLAGDTEAIRSKWFLGGRKVAYRFACRLDTRAHAVRFREAVVESSWGIPPPTFTVETTTTSGWERSGSRTDLSPGGGGSLDLGPVREALRIATESAGWRFEVEPGRVP